jgi:D-aminopeptidase
VTERARDLGLRFGRLEPGRRNSIADVGEVVVGHRTVSGDADGCARTGVTVVLPHQGNLFREKVPAAVHVINGFGKPAGFAQVEELGTLETPIALTTTLAVGRAFDGLVSHALAECPEIGVSVGSVNPVVLECNDQRLNDARARHVVSEHVLEAIRAATDAVAEGGVGAGTGMICYGWKGGIGTSSRLVESSSGSHRLGVLVLSNFGRPSDFRWRRRTFEAVSGSRQRGSCAIVVATDAPLGPGELRRVAARTQYGVARTGTYGEDESGEYALAFSTARRAPDGDPSSSRSAASMETLFEACADATEEAIVNSLVAGRTTRGCGGAVAHAVPHRELETPA